MKKIEIKLHVFGVKKFRKFRFENLTLYNIFGIALFIWH